MGEVYSLIRMVSAVFGALFVILIFLIGKELFGRTAGLWAAASSAIAIDFIMLSRVVLVDIFLYTFIASTIFFYVKYRNSEKPALYLIGLLISLVLMFGSKNAQWLVVIPPILYVEIMSNKKRVLKTINFLIVVGVAWFIHSSFIYPPEISNLAQEFFTGGANKNLIEPHLDVFFKSIISINSYLYLMVFALTIVFYLGAIGLSERRINWNKIKRHLISPTPYTFLIFVAAISLLVFSLTSLSLNSKYIGQISIPFFILGGFVIVRFWKHKPLRFVFLILLLVGAFSAVLYSPSYEGYPSQSIIYFSRPNAVMMPQFTFLEELGNPPVLTNEINMLLFYPGQAIPVPIKDSPLCTQELLVEVQSSGTIGIFKNVGEVEKGFLCDIVSQYREEFLSEQTGIPSDITVVKY